MKVKYILKSCIDVLCSKDSGKLCFAETEDAVLLTPDGTVCYRIPKGIAPVEVSKHRERPVLAGLWKEWQDALDSGSYRTATRSYRIDSPEGELAVFNENVYVDARRLKGFDKNAEIRIRDPKEPVLVLENDEFVGVVYPVNMEGRR